MQHTYILGGNDRIVIYIMVSWIFLEELYMILKRCKTRF